MDAKYRAYIKDCLNLNGTPKAFVTVLDGDIAGDALTRSSSSFTCLDDIPDIVNEGDVIVVYEPSGQTIYQGVISAINQKTIDADQIYSLFDYDWFTRQWSEDTLEHEIADIFNDFIAGKIGEVVSSVPTANETNWLINKLSYVLNGEHFDQYRVNKDVEQVQDPSTGTYTENVTYQTVKLTGSSSTTLPDDQIDSMFAKKYGGFTVTYEGKQELHLPTPEDNSSLRNMEDFIYELFSNYNIVLEIRIPFNSGCSINIKTADYSGTKIAKNSANIISISPTTEVEDTNKLVVFSSEGG